MENLAELDQRSRDIFRHVVEGFLESGGPVGSRTLSRALATPLSAASIRNVMADLEEMGLLYAPHVSAGRLPTERGLRMFVDGLLEVGAPTPPERRVIEAQMSERDGPLEDMLTEATSLLSGLCQCAGVVLAPRQDGGALKHIEFAQIDAGRALVVLVFDDGHVENRVIATPKGMMPSVLIEAANYLNARLKGRSLAEAADAVRAEIRERRSELDELATKVVEAGLAIWSGDEGALDRRLIVRGRSHLLDDVAEVDIARIRQLFDDLEEKAEFVELLDLAGAADGVKIFIGSENKLFSLSGSSMIVAPYMSPERKVVGAIGVIGPTRMNYGRIVPVVDYTARAIGRILSSRSASEGRGWDDAVGRGAA